MNCATSKFYWKLLKSTSLVPDHRSGWKPVQKSCIVLVLSSVSRNLSIVQNHICVPWYTECFVSNLKSSISNPGSTHMHFPIPSSKHTQLSNPQHAPPHHARRHARSMHSPACPSPYSNSDPTQPVPIGTTWYCCFTLENVHETHIRKVKHCPKFFFHLKI